MWVWEHKMPKCQKQTAGSRNSATTGAPAPQPSFPQRTKLFLSWTNSEPPFAGVHTTPVGVLKDTTPAATVTPATGVGPATALHPPPASTETAGAGEGANQ